MIINIHNTRDIGLVSIHMSLFIPNGSGQNNEMHSLTNRRSNHLQEPHCNFLILNDTYWSTHISEWRKLIHKKGERTMYLHEPSKATRSSNIVYSIKDSVRMPKMMRKHIGRRRCDRHNLLTHWKGSEMRL